MLHSVTLKFNNIFADKIFKTVRGNFLKQWVSRYLTFVDLRLGKIVLHNKIPDKTRAIKNQENSTHCFG